MLIENESYKFDSWHWQLQNRIDSAEKVILWLKENNLFEQISPLILKRIKTWQKLAPSWQISFRFAVSPYYLRFVDWQNADCPILRQILPSPEEFNDKIDKSNLDDWDPLAEEKNMPVRGLTHRYPDRVLWYLSHSCALYCRFCMRKRKVSQAESAPSQKEWELILNYIRSHREIKEVILSGGDPLSLEDKHIDYILKKLREIDHLYSIRIHTRMLVTLPMRITASLAKILAKHYPITIVTHFNHPKELENNIEKNYVKQAVRLLRMSGVDVLNQTVLLRGVNDSAKIQEKLNLKLLTSGIRAYYLHRCDEIPGTEHFRVPLEKGIKILKALRGTNPGISLPRYMVDLPGGGGKVPLEVNYLTSNNIKGDSIENKSTSANHSKKKNIVYSLVNWEGKSFEIHERQS